MLPWQVGRSIYEAVAAGEHELPDEPPHDPTKLRWSAGSMEGVMARHAGLLEKPGRVARVLRRHRDAASELADRILRLARDPSDDTRLAVYTAACDENLLAHLDATIERLAESGAERGTLAPHARWLVTAAGHRGPVKLGIALLGVSGGPDDAALVETLAANDEFTLYCSVALQNLLDDPTDALWAVARVAKGWGKIEAVERLAQAVADRPDVRRWLLTDGCANAIMDEYLALDCATAGGLAGALAGEVDDALLDGACTIVTALCTGGPAGDLGDYEEAGVTVPRLIDALDGRADTLHRLETVVALDRWYETEGPPEARERLRPILEDPRWPDRLRHAYEHGDDGERWTAWQTSRALGVDLWDMAFERLRHLGPEHGLVQHLTQDPARRERVVRWIEDELPVERLASGPDRHLFPEPEIAEIAGAVESAVQRMDDGKLFSPRLVAAALLAPVMSMRNGALNALEATPRERWGEAAAALERLAREEPDGEVRKRARALL